MKTNILTDFQVCISVPLNVSSCVLFHAKTRVSLKYFVKDCSLPLDLEISKHYTQKDF